MILFLDFDGVLHPQYEGQATPADVAFCHLPRFEAVMRDFPDVEIVISSSWREHLSLDALRARFSPDIAQRITATTFVDTPGAPPPIERREWEIVSWLIAQGRQDEPWIALDDAVWQFGAHRARVVGCASYSGLDDAAERALRLALQPVDEALATAKRERQERCREEVRTGADAGIVLPYLAGACPVDEDPAQAGRLLTRIPSR